MKKIKLLLLGILLFSIIDTNAANYVLKELIPLNIETTIVTDNFSYKNFYYNGKGMVIFQSIKNISKKDLPISISIGLFDDNKKNIGTINYCQKEDILLSKEEKSYVIQITNDQLAKEKTIDNIHYISILKDNINCRTTGSEDYVGQKVEDIGKIKDREIKSDTKLFLRIIGILATILGIVLLYRFMFTNSFKNFNGDDLRKDYKKYNKKLAEEREEKLKKNPPKEKEVEPKKTQEVLMQEEEAKKTESTDLENYYK